MKIFFTGDEIKFILAAFIASAIVGGALLLLFVGFGKLIDSKDSQDDVDDKN